MTWTGLETSAFFLTGYVGLLLAAAAYDVSRFRIPNWLSVTLGVLFLAAAACGLAETNWVRHLAAGLAVFTVGALFFFLGWLGGGDVKLMAAGSLWLGPGNLFLYVLAVSILGGVLTVALILVRRAVPRLAAGVGRRSDVSLPRVLEQGERIPYGVAIAAGALLLLDRLPLSAGWAGA